MLYSISVETIKLVGYYNCNYSSPEITFNSPTDLDDDRKLVIITLEFPPDGNDLNLKFKTEDLIIKTKKLESGLKKLIQSTKKI